MTISISQPDWQLDDPIPALVISKLSHMGIITIEGEQAEAFLHGQVTADITGLEKDNWCWGAHCDPKGKMLASFRAFKTDEALNMLLPKSALALDLAQLQKYAVFSKAELKDVSNEISLFGIAGNEAEQWIKKVFGDITQAVTQVEQGVILKDGTADTPRFILAIKDQAVDTQLEGVTVYDASAWQAIEIAAGYPNLTAEHANQFVPQMCNLQALNGISFTKGCYMGQETVARMKYRGGNKRAMYIVKGSYKHHLSLESKLEIAIEDGFRKAGSIIECEQRGEQIILTAVLANDTADDAKLRFADDLDSSLGIQPLPYSLAEDY